MALTLYPNDNYDAFITVADCDSFLNNNVPPAQLTDYTSLDETTKEIYIRQATTLIKNSITLPDTLETNLQYATAYLVNHSINKDMTNSSANSNLKIKEIDGVIKKEWFSPNKNDNDLPDIVQSFLKAYDVVSDGTFSFLRG